MDAVTVCLFSFLFSMSDSDTPQCNNDDAPLHHLHNTPAQCPPLSMQFPSIKLTVIHLHQQQWYVAFFFFFLFFTLQFGLQATHMFDHTPTSLLFNVMMTHTSGALSPFPFFNLFHV
jgi:hypothetical protein